MLSPWIPAVVALATTAGAAGLPSEPILTLTTVTVTNTDPWPTDITWSPVPMPTVDVPVPITTIDVPSPITTIADPSPSPCGQLSICEDYLKTCGTTAVLTYGGCYLACSPKPTFVPPPCPSPDASLTTVSAYPTGGGPIEIPGFPMPEPTVAVPDRV